MELVSAGPGTMSAIAAAVTPVVMISANAILVGGISTKHEAMSTRIRLLTAEFRLDETTESRRATIRAELRLFDQRLNLIARAHILLYLAIACFIVMVISIAVTTLHGVWSTVSLPLLISGVGLTFVAIVMEVLDLAKARRTIGLETRDVLRDERR